jgi:hypothetical protein
MVTGLPIFVFFANHGPDISAPRSPQIILEVTQFNQNHTTFPPILIATAGDKSSSNKPMKNTAT